MSRVSVNPSAIKPLLQLIGGTHAAGRWNARKRLAGRIESRSARAVLRARLGPVSGIRESTLQMYQQQGNRSRRQAGDARSLAYGFGLVLVELLLHFLRQSAHSAIIEFERQQRRLVLLAPQHLVALTRDVAVVLDLDLDLLGYHRVLNRLARAWQGHQAGVAHIRAAQQISERILSLYAFA